VVAAVVLPAERRRVGELLRLDEVLEAQLGRVDPQLVRQPVHHPLDGMDRLGDTERAAIGDAARRLVGINAVHLYMGGWDLVRASADGEQAGRELGGV